MGEAKQVTLDLASLSEECDMVAKNIDYTARVADYRQKMTMPIEM
jgi:hypothetical protein